MKLEKLNQLLALLLTCECHGVVRTENGSMFISPTPIRGKSAFLHSLYEPCQQGCLENIQNLFDQELPSSYANFLRRHNGARLFNGSIYVYGWCGEISRSLALEARQPISIESQLRQFRATNPSEWAAGWRPIGSLVAVDRWPLLINSTGEVIFFDGGEQMRPLGSFEDALLRCAIAVGRHFECDGLIGKDYAALESTIAHLGADIRLQ